MSVLVTGANGFVGSAVARRLLAHGMPVRGLVRLGSDCSNLEGLAIESMQGDIRDPPSLAAAVRGCSAVIHVAADYRLWVPRPDDMLRTNLQGSLNVLEAARAGGVARMVYTSSVATLGTRGDGSPADETTPVALCDMIGSYKRSKFLAEAAVTERARALDFDLVIVNPSTPIGPGDIKPTPTGRIIADAMAGRLPAYVDTGLNIVHVDDAAEGHVLALLRGERGERYILGGTDMSLYEILANVAERIGRRPPRLKLPRAPLYPVAALMEAWARATGAEPQLTRDALRMAGKKMYYSSAKAARVLGYRARPATEAIADAVTWFSQRSDSSHERIHGS
jgi:dihydroflavonol-4-reductase